MSGQLAGSGAFTGTRGNVFIKCGAVMDESQRVVLKIAMFEAGIVPFHETTCSVMNALESTSPEEALKLKRKFRKLTRRALAQRQRRAHEIHHNKITQVKDCKKCVGASHKRNKRLSTRSKRRLLFQGFELEALRLMGTIL